MNYQYRISCTYVKKERMKEEEREMKRKKQERIYCGEGNKNKQTKKTLRLIEGVFFLYEYGSYSKELEKFSRLP